MHNPAKFEAANIAFIFIDLQSKLLDKISDASRVVARNVLLLNSAKLLHVPYVVTTQYKKGLGELDKSFAENVHEAVDKLTFSCAASSEFHNRLDSLQKDWIAISGVETHICVLQTTLDLLREGRNVAVVSDAVASRGAEDHERGLNRMEKAGALIVTTEMLIYELLQRSDTENFKKLLPLIKNL